MKRAERLGLRHGPEIRKALERFGDHEEMRYERIVAWLAQFKDQDIRVAKRVLSGIKYFSASNIRAMCRNLLSMVLVEAGAIARARICIVPIGGPGSGSNVIARVLKDLLNAPSFRGVRLQQMSELERIPADKVDLLVFVDDFSGTGDTLREWWTNVEQLVLPKNAKVLVGLLVGTERALKATRESFADRAIAAEELAESDDALSGTSSFTTSDKRVIRKYCRRTKCSKDFVFGYGSCGLLVAFKHGCPNNSLPIIWAQSGQWTALFRRRAI